ncbi:hypothetical protein P154DRAFT_524863 [Amniculicola lignicola CBS 123094]|uniref:Uncharacterized protein n=1 Tax=Amniculicola lignicola CBS 123094 TaxID=1392246 RepID=A0A6A5W7N6_9PLEO|nr:hypothetical protein P154DRAFT_524863 [Amniculicola lignicola CBS 123094]
MSFPRKSPIPRKASLHVIYDSPFSPMHAILGLGSGHAHRRMSGEEPHPTGPACSFCFFSSIGE